MAYMPYGRMSFMKFCLTVSPHKEIGYPKTLVTQARLQPKCRARLALVKLCLLTKRRNRSFLSSAVSIFCFFFDLKMAKYSSSNIRYLP